MKTVRDYLQSTAPQAVFDSYVKLYDPRSKENELAELHRRIDHLLSELCALPSSQQDEAQKYVLFGMPRFYPYVVQVWAECCLQEDVLASDTPRSRAPIVLSPELLVDIPVASVRVTEAHIAEILADILEQFLFWDWTVEEIKRKQMDMEINWLQSSLVLNPEDAPPSEGEKATHTCVADEKEEQLYQTINRDIYYYESYLREKEVLRVRQWLLDQQK